MSLSSSPSTRLSSPGSASVTTSQMVNTVALNAPGLSSEISSLSASAPAIDISGYLHSSTKDTKDSQNRQTSLSLDSTRPAVRRPQLGLRHVHLTTHLTHPQHLLEANSSR
ncbi:hypothetical protein NMY22_g9192 [Coprinellus aureogranulatus]|nr:hypothetical protein NMY22_g9192 [Coprinellus aureogranulatus]